MPADTELGEWIRPHFAFPIAAHHVSVTDRGCVLPWCRVRDAGINERLRIQLVQHRQLLYVLVHHPVTVDIAHASKVWFARQPGHQHGVQESGRLDQSVQVRYRQPLLLHQPMKAVLVA